ncbi:MAG TPA: hypothetical protein PJ992_00480 [Arachnia sp.]|nr:hypothetical protein [Arachnia sp.]
MMQDRKTLGYVLSAIGGVLALIGFIWGRVGYYSDQFVFLAGLLLGGAALIWVGQRYVRQAKSAEDDERLNRP